MMESLLPLLGLLLGAAISYFLTKKLFGTQGGVSTERFAALEADKKVLEDRIQRSLEVFEQQKKELGEERNKTLQLHAEAERWKTEYRNLEQRLNEQKTEIEQLNQKLADQFKAVANDILKQHSKDFSEHNQKSMSEILNPLKEKIQNFEKKVEETYDKELRDKISLKEQIVELTKLNTTISEEANNLTKALKGEAKKQGNWGEMVLERILESSGLEEGREYEKQFSMKDEAGDRIQPDFIVKLPDQKHIVVDSKVSLVAYERFVSATEDADREIHMRNHLLSLKKHIDDLSSKHYHAASAIHSPDFVLLFVPIESSFSLAVQADQDLFTYAWDRKVVIVSPSTLLASLKTISSIWKQENQNKNALEIARQSGALYDKFVGFVEDLKKVGETISRSQKAYEDAMGKLKEGSGNLIGRAERIKKLGAKTEKNIDRSLIEEEENLLD